MTNVDTNGVAAVDPTEWHEQADRPLLLTDPLMHQSIGCSTNTSDAVRPSIHRLQITYFSYETISNISNKFRYSTKTKHA